MLVLPLPALDPAEAVQKLADLPSLAWLDSARYQDGLGRYSFVLADPFGRFSVQQDRARWTGPDALTNHEPLAALRGLLARYQQAHRADLPPFQGGAVGYLAYEFGRCVERQPVPARDDLALPQASLGFYDLVLAWDHLTGQRCLISTGWPEPDPALRASRARGRADWLLAHLHRPAIAAPRFVPVPRQVWQVNARPLHEAAVARVVDYILAGDIFQANLAQCFAADLPVGFDPLGFYLRLRQTNAAPFAAYLADGDTVIASSSPERFVTLQGERIEARPIKGTIHRAADPVEDAALAASLMASDKDRAENVMIVDLLRNDISRICRPHTVEVPVLCGLESYASVHHLVSVVTGQLQPGRDGVDMLAACFPGGSITGAPKPRAMEIIAELEGRVRGIFCGSIGYLGFDGWADLNIAIRTVAFAGGRAEFQAGGGITALSDPAQEYDETLTKAARIFAAFADPAADPADQP